MPASNANATSELKVSGKFCAPDADLIFVSSDNIVFKIHSMYVNEATTMGFPSVSENIAIGSDPVRLSEPADVLEVLFQFVEPPNESQNYRQPSAVGLNPILFFGLAEAAEKYIVYGAMNICMARMSFMIETHPLEALNHCYKHGYTDLADRAAELSIPKPLKEAALKLTAPGLLSKWLIYYDEWRFAANVVVAAFEELTRSGPENVTDSTCHLWTRLAITYACQVNKNPLTIKQRPSLPANSTLIKCGECSCKDLPNNWPPWFDELAELSDSILHKFSTIDGSK